MSKIVMDVIQVIAGLVVVYIIYVLALLAIKADKLMIDEQLDQAIKREINVINGVLNAGENASMGKFNQWNTTLPFSMNYLPIRPSVNIKGGAQFTYTFWIYVGDPANALNKVILLKGDKESYTFQVSQNTLDINTRQLKPMGNIQTVRDRVVMCPMISFGDEEMEFKVTFNTFHKIHETLYVKKIRDENNMYRNNIMSLFSRQWMHISVVFEDNVPINDFENGISVKFYINDVLYQSGTYASTLRQNNGDLYLFPDEVAIKDCKLSNLRYYNYALSDMDVRKLAASQPNLTPAASSSQSSSISLLQLSDYNRMDIFNA